MADAWPTLPELVAAHEIEILTVAPELRGTVPATRETLTSLAVPAERTRFYSRLRTLRIAHGITELVRDHTLLCGAGPVTLAVDDLDNADPTDRELVAVLVRRLDPALVTVVVGTGPSVDGDPLVSALAKYATRHDLPPDSGSADLTGDRALAYVVGDGTSDDPELLAAYQALDPVRRQRMHDDRAAQLSARGEPSLALGAIPYHRERGSDPAGAGVRALRVALDACIDTGFYDATVDLAARGRALIDRAAEPEMWWAFTTKLTTSLAALGRPAEAEALYDEIREQYTDPVAHMQAAYATAMLYTRHYEDRRDHRRALGWINQAIAIAVVYPDESQRVFQSVFNYNGRALIEHHLGRPEQALRMVTDGLRRMDAAYQPDQHRLHRSVLRYNRAQVLLAVGRLDEALVDYDQVISDDPHYAEYYFDRAAIHRRLGRTDAALADYRTAIRLSPPFPELYYNRGDLLAAGGDLDGALADFSYVLELDPSHVDAYVNRAALLAELGDPDAARRDVAAGLALAGDQPHLLCLLGNLELEAGHLDAARAALDVAVLADPPLAEAWASRAAVAVETGDPEGALADLDRALALGDDPAMRFNRAMVLADLHRWADAAAEFDRVIELTPDDADAWLHRAACHRHIGATDRADADLRRFAELAPDRAGEPIPR